MERENVKQNINFLEYPLWFQDEIVASNTEQGMIWKDREGYVYKAGYKAPVKTDAIFLLYLLMQSQRQNYGRELSLTRYQILRDCGLAVNAQWYNRLEDSLERWKMVGIKFVGTFYDGESYSAINFGIIDSWSIHEKTKELKVTFSPSFIKMMLGKGFFKYINFAEFKRLRSPLATRLYEILCKSFYGRDTWEISAAKMAEKIPMKERYPAHIVPKIKTAINRINKCSDTKFLLETRKIDRGQTVLCFKKTVATKTLLPFHQPENESFIIPDNGKFINPESSEVLWTAFGEQLFMRPSPMKNGDYLASYNGKVRLMPLVGPKTISSVNSDSVTVNDPFEKLDLNRRKNSQNEPLYSSEEDVISNDWK